MTHPTARSDRVQVPGPVRQLEWDERTEDHVARHSLTVHEVNQVVVNGHVLVRNRRTRRAEYLMIGTTHGGRVVTVALRKTREDGVWRVATAYDATVAQREVLRNNRA